MTELIKTHRYNIDNEGLACKIKVTDIERGKDIEMKFSPMALKDDEMREIWGDKDANRFVGLNFNRFASIFQLNSN